MKPILEIKNVSKKFRIGHEQRQYLDLRDSITSLFRFSKTTTEDFYSLRDVSFNVEAGQTIGIIGRNGAGKSTLLKILSKITPPTSGKIISRGRVASLLEVGTGFHPELTGRENIFLNGSILGMKHKEIESKYDEIVDFSGVEKFLDTPLKHYSSGMQLRLAFSVAAFLEPEILVIDEVLAVGDAEFQKKCLGKMEQVTKSGRTILFVSHNLGAVKTLCKNGILLENGLITKKGTIKTTIDTYQLHLANNQKIRIVEPPIDKAISAYVQKITIEDVYGKPTELINVGSPWQIRVLFSVRQITPHFIMGVGFCTMDSIPFRTSWSQPQSISPGTYEAIFKDSTVQLGAGKYRINIGLSSREQVIQYLPDVIAVEFEKIENKDIALENTY